MEYSNKELNEIREAGYNHGYSVGYNEGTYDTAMQITDSIVKQLEEAKHQIALSDEILEYYQEALNDAIEIVKSSIIPEPVKNEPKRVIGYDDYGKPLHEGDFCTFDVNATDWRFKPDNIRKSGLATLEGQITYNEQDKCYELSIDNDYCPALYFHAIEPGTLKLKESKEQTKEQSFRKNNKEIER